MLNRSFNAGRAAVREAAPRPTAASRIVVAAPAHQGRGSANLALADSILRLAGSESLPRARPGVGVVKTDVNPVLEPVDPDVNDGDPSRDPEPYDPTIGALGAEETRQGDDEEEDDEEDMPEEAALLARQDEGEDDGDDMQNESVDVTIVEIDEENELGSDDEPMAV